MLLKLRGEDLVGIVPADFQGAYAKGLFPEETKVFDTVAIEALGDDWRKIKKFVRWRPLEATCEPRPKGSKASQN